MTSKPGRGWCVVDRWGNLHGWTFNRTRLWAIFDFMEMLGWSVQGSSSSGVMKRWRRERYHGCRCVRVEVREIGGEDG